MERDSVNPTDHATPSTPTVGLTIMAVIVLAVAAWMVRESGRLTPTAPGAAAEPAPELAGFRRDVWFLPDDAMLGFVEIPASPFLMGSDPAVDRLAFENERWSTDQVQALVDLPTFYIGRFEVTVAQFQAFASATGAGLGARGSGGPPDHPISGITWPDALAYTRWLDGALRESAETPAPLRALLDDGWRIALPAEAEWEKAARGEEGRIFPWGNEATPGRANYSTEAPVPVGSIECPDCAYGLADMSGNVWEWTRSPYRPYPYEPGVDATDLATDALWVIRGGSYADAAQNVRAAIRGGGDPGVRRPFIGFRLAISR